MTNYLSQYKTLKILNAYIDYYMHEYIFFKLYLPAFIILMGIMLIQLISNKILNKKDYTR